MLYWITHQNFTSEENIHLNIEKIIKIHIRNQQTIQMLPLFRFISRVI